MLYRPSYLTFEPKFQDTSAKSPGVDATLEAHEPTPGSACRLASNGIVNCFNCLDLVHNHFVQSTAEGAQSYLEIVRQIEDAGSNGLTHKIVYVCPILSR